MTPRYFRSALLTGALAALVLAAMPTIAATRQGSRPSELKRSQKKLLLREGREHIARAREALGLAPLPGIPATDEFVRERAKDLDDIIGLARPSRTAQPTSVLGSPPPANHQVNNRGVEPVGTGQSETTIAAFGSNLLAGWNDGDAFNHPAPSNGLGVGSSNNAGATWTDLGAPPVPRVNWEWTSDPVITVNDKTGEFYYLGMCDSLNAALTTDVVNGIALAKGTFTGGTFNFGTTLFIRTVSSSVNFIDKPWVAVDSLTGNVYVSYTLFGASDEINFQRSTTDGASWDAPLKLSSTSENGLVQGSRPAVGPNGEVYVVWYSIGPVDVDFFNVRKSTTAGVSFTPTATAVSFLANYGTGAPGFNRGQGIEFPSIATDRSAAPTATRGNVYLAWNESINFYDNAPAVGSPKVEVESNNTSGTATPFTMGQLVRGGISGAGDLDFFSFTATQNQTIVFWSDSSSSTLSYFFRIMCSDGTTPLAYSDAGLNGGLAGLIVYTIPTTGTYFVRVTRSNTGTGGYRFRTGLTTPSVGERARDHRDVFVAKSADGVTWGTPVLVNDDLGHFDNWLPEVAVGTGAPAAGQVYTIWYDFRDSAPCGGNSNVYISRSPDAGTSWVSLGPTTDLTSAWPIGSSNIAPNQGDYLGLFANGTGVYPCWADMRNGDPDVFMNFWTLASTPVQISLVGAVAEPGRVTLTWFATDAPGLNATVERSSGDGSWSAIGSVSPDAGGRMIYADTAVEPGARYGYRLALSESGRTVYLGETWVDVPSGLELALGTPRPNPATRDIWVSLTLPSTRPARLLLLDVAGRIVRSREIGGKVGGQLVNLGEGAALPPGVYLIRLEQEHRSATTRVSVVQ